MGKIVIIACLPFIHLAALVLCSDIDSTILPIHDEHRKLQGSASISTRQMDITTPLTTIPTATNPLPDSKPEPPLVMNPANPTMTPLSTNSTASSSSPAGSWCVASRSVSQAALQVALDYACGHGGADCTDIQTGGRCYSPNTVREHASYAFNSYYQKNPVPTSCNFGGNAVTTSTDPSYGTCQYPSTSTSSSLLNISSSSGSRVFGGGRPITTPSSSGSVIPTCIPYSHYLLPSLVVLLAVP